QPYVKWSTEARRLEDLPRIVRRAVKTATAHPTGPVFLSLPVDVLNAERDIELGASTRVAPRIVGDRKAIDEAAKKLARAERPLLVAGDAVAHSNALAELVELAELLGAPVVTEGVASTCSFPFSHPLYIGSFPRLAPPIRAFLMRYDLMCSIGGGLFTLSPPARIRWGRSRSSAPWPRPRPRGPPSSRRRSRQPPVCVTSSGARIPRASSACAAAASAGACRRRSASSSRCPIARSSR